MFDSAEADTEMTDRRPLAVGALTTVGTALVFGVVTGLIPNPVYVRMVPRTPLDYLFLGSSALLLGVYAIQRTRARIDRDDDGVAALGVVGGVLAFGCPVCNAVLLTLFSGSAIMTYFDPLRPLVGLLTVGLLGGLVSYRHTRCDACTSDEATRPGEAAD
jgi:hypothetical protein